MGKTFGLQKFIVEHIMIDRSVDGVSYGPYVGFHGSYK